MRSTSLERQIARALEGETDSPTFEEADSQAQSWLSARDREFLKLTVLCGRPSN